MFNETLKAKVNREVGRINGELCDLKEHEESLRVRKARLEVEMRQAIAMRDMFELMGRLGKQPEPACIVRHDPVLPNHPNGPQFVSFDDRAATAPREDDNEETAPGAKHKHKPDGLPTYQQMVQTVLEHAAPRWLAPKQMTAMIQQTWWSDIPANKAASTAWGMARRGMIDKRGSRYRAKLNGHARADAAVLANGATR